VPEGLPLSQREAVHDPSGEGQAGVGGTSSDSFTPPRHNFVGMHLWQFRWVRDIAAIVVVVLVCIAAYSIREWVMPVLIGLALAYIANPVVTWAKRKHGIARLRSSVILACMVAALLLAIVAAVLPPVISQAMELQQNAPKYVQALSQKLGLKSPGNGQPKNDKTNPDNPNNGSNDTNPSDANPPPESTSDSTPGESQPPSPDDAQNQQTPAPAPSVQPTPIVGPNGSASRDGGDAGASDSFWYSLVPAEWSTLGRLAVRSLNYGVQAFNAVSYFLVATFIATFCFVYFSWKFGNVLGTLEGFIPSQHRERTLEILGRMDQSIAGFVRGRLVQSAIMGILLSVGWAVVGVPYALLLGLLAGLFNLVPFFASVIAIAAVGLSVADQAQSDHFNLLWPILALGVYLLAQGLEGWLIEPYVQGKATDLDPLTIVLAVIFGGALAGLLGVFVAIPAAACLKILAKELLIPWLKEWIAKWE